MFILVITFILVFFALSVSLVIWSQQRLDEHQARIQRLESQLIETQLAQTPAKKARRGS